MTFLLFSWYNKQDCFSFALRVPQFVLNDTTKKLKIHEANKPEHIYVTTCS